MYNKRTSTRKGNFFRTLIISYIIILIIPIFISVFSYIESLRIIDNEVNEFRDMVLTQFRQNIDSALEEIESIADYIIWNPEIKWIVNTAGGGGNSPEKETLNIINRLKSLGRTSSLIKRIYILGSTKKEPDADSLFYFPEDYSGKKFNWKALPFGGNKQYITDASGTDSIVYLKKIPILSPGTASAYTAIFLDRKKLEKRLMNMEWLSRGGGIIYDRDNNPIVSSFDNLPGKSALHKEYVESVKQSEINGWKYVSILSKSFLYQKVTYLRIVIIFSVILCAVSGLLAAYLLAVRNYDPVKNILGLFMKKGAETDEFSFIENSINEILTVNRDMREKLDRQKELLKKRFLSRLISGRNIRSSESVLESCRTYDISADCKLYVVIIYHIEDFSVSELSGEIAWKLYQDTIESVSFAFFDKDVFKTWFTEIDGQIVELIGVESTVVEEDVYIKISSFADELMARLEKLSSPLITTAVSNIHDNIDSVSLAYNEALEAIEYELLIGKGNIIFYKNLPESETSVSSFAPVIDIQIRVINSIRGGDFPSARKIMSAFTDKMMAEKINLNIVKSRMSSLVTTVLDILNIMNFQGEELTGRQDEIISSLLKCSNIPDLQNFLDLFFDFLENSIQTDKSNRKADTIVSEAADYIRNNYTDNNLSGGLVAESQDVTIQYLSMIFKKKKGTGLLDYIHLTRIKKCKEYLKETRLTVKEIAVKTGYYNDLAFIRSFKKYEGTTPGKYREFDL